MADIEARQAQTVREAAIRGGAAGRAADDRAAAAGGPLMSDAPKGIEPRFDELMHAPTRLSIVALLAAADWADFTFVRDSLSKQISILDRPAT